MDWSFVYDGSEEIVTTAISAVVAYAAIIILLRISGKRTLPDMNAFDFVVTVALGSALATTILSASVSLAEGLAAIAVLVGLQAIVAFLAARSKAVRRAVKSEPALLVRDGQILDAALRDARLSRAEVLAAVRAEGQPDLADIAAVVLETNGDLSVIANDPREKGAPLEAV